MLRSLIAPWLTFSGDRRSVSLGVGEDPLRVIQLTLFYPPYVGGIETHTSEIGKALSSFGLSVEVVCFAATNNGPTEPSVRCEDGVKVIRVRSGRILGWIRMAWTLHSLGDGVVHVQGYSRPLLLLVRLLRTRRTWVITPHGLQGAGRDDNHRAIVGIFKRLADMLLMNWLLDGAAFIFALTHVEKEFADLRFGSVRSLRTINLGSPVPAAASVPAQSDPGSSGRLLMLSRLVPRKRVADLLAVAAAHSSLPDCDIAGPEGADSALLRSLADALPPGRANMIGQISGAAKYELLRGAVALILCSEYEALSIGAMEALAQGTPVIASTGAALCLPDEGVVRFPTGDLNGLADAIRRVTDPADQQRFREEAALAGRSMLNVETYSKTLAEYYLQTIREK